MDELTEAHRAREHNTEVDAFRRQWEAENKRLAEAQESSSDCEGDFGDICAFMEGLEDDDSSEALYKKDVDKQSNELEATAIIAMCDSPQALFDCDSSVEASEAAMRTGHFGRAADICTESLGLEILSEGERAHLMCVLAEVNRRAGHVHASIVAAQRGLEIDPSNTDLHYAEGQAWQLLDCLQESVACFGRGLLTNPDHAGCVFKLNDIIEAIQGECLECHTYHYIEGVAWQALGAPDTALEALYKALELYPSDPTLLERIDQVNQDLAWAAPSARQVTVDSKWDPLMLMTSPERGPASQICTAVLPEDRAEELVKLLTSADSSDWNEITARKGAAAVSKGMKAAKMGFSIYEGAGLDQPWLLGALSEALSVAPHERLTISAATYSRGSFLDEHTDAPSGSESYDRVRAFVLHLSKGFSREDGGLFVDQETGQDFVPQWNTLLHFAVPRWHAVTPMTSDKKRISIYGWVLTPVIKLVDSAAKLSQLVKQSRAVAIGNFPVDADGSQELGTCFGAAAHEPTGDGVGTRGDYIQFCCTQFSSDELGVKLYVDGVDVGHAKDSCELRDLLNSFWQHIDTPMCAGTKACDSALSFSKLPNVSIYRAAASADPMLERITESLRGLCALVVCSDTNGSEVDLQDLPAFEITFESASFWSKNYDLDMDQNIDAAKKWIRQLSRTP